MNSSKNRNSFRWEYLYVAIFILNIILAISFGLIAQGDRLGWDGDNKAAFNAGVATFARVFIVASLNLFLFILMVKIYKNLKTNKKSKVYGGLTEFQLMTVLDELETNREISIGEISKTINMFEDKLKVIFDLISKRIECILFDDETLSVIAETELDIDIGLMELELEMKENFYKESNSGLLSLFIVGSIFYSLMIII